ncbi:hypothetical protein GCM10010121_069920 [Streptomyces brasiliensis]|uniref:Uncharacterized protein n=1 Tax=Streptomyces brasiliensis TaxID=1954 RepID=A0A917L6Y7_9ACTN|nr:hypothetical protein GCM10010121_069920 [Streptomyces brasiliensis]
MSSRHLLGRVGDLRGREPYGRSTGVQVAGRDHGVEQFVAMLLPPSPGGLTWRAPWTLRLQTGRLASIEQVRGMTTGFRGGREALRNVDAEIGAMGRPGEHNR